MTGIDFRSQVPSYRQLADILRAAIAAGTWGPDDRFPSLDALAEDYGLARSTVQKALAVLKAEGAVYYSASGRGTFVRP